MIKRPGTRATLRWTLRAAAAACGTVLLPAPSARADDAAIAARPAEDWTSRYEAARRHMLAGEHARAAMEFDALAKDARSDSERRLALEMAQVADALELREARTGEPIAPSGPPIRTRDEISILYASAFLYGVGTGTWFLLETQPDSALTATLPFAAITAAPIVALATIDGNHPLPRGMPHAITDGLFLGIGEGLWVTSYQHARADRTESSRWQPETVASVLWGGATLGGIGAGALAAGLSTTPGRISFTASTAIWSGVVTGLAASALLPENDHRAENASLAAGFGYNVGLFGGMFLAGSVSPSVTRVRLVDLSGATGALAAAGTYLSLAHRDTDPRIGVGVAAAGAATGLALGTLFTAKMGREVPDGNGALHTVTWQPIVKPVPGGIVVGAGGFM